jgi:hypothetical protein
MEADTLYVINSKDELLSWVPCAGAVSDIDWEKETLLITWDRRCNADSKVVEKKFEETAENVFLFQVKINPSYTTNAARLIIYTIVPKLPKNATVTFVIDLQGGENHTVAQLQNTSWKLTGFVDVTDNKLTEAEPKDCVECYTLNFETDSAGTGKSVAHSFEIQLYPKPSFILGSLTDIYEGGNVALFYEAIKTIDSYRLEDGKLKFFYDNGGKYLLYEQVENTPGNKIDIQDYLLRETSCTWLHSKLKADSIYVINAQEELFAIISCEGNDTPNIDFEKYSLLFIYGGATSGISNIAKMLQQTSATNYELGIDITLNMTTEAPRWEIALLTLKLPNNLVLKLNENIHH